MTNNPFNRSFDRAVKGKYARVSSDGRAFEGWVERVHHGRGSVVMHDVTTDDGENLGSVFVRSPGVVEVLKPKKRIQWRDPAELTPHPDHNRDFTPDDNVVRSCYRNLYAGSFPVIREDGTIINGHKRVAAARVAGLDRHPVEVISVTDKQAAELFKIAHRGQESSDDENTDGGERPNEK